MTRGRKIIPVEVRDSHLFNLLFAFKWLIDSGPCQTPERQKIKKKNLMKYCKAYLQTIWVFSWNDTTKNLNIIQILQRSGVWNCQSQNTRPEVPSNINQMTFNRDNEQIYYTVCIQICNLCIYRTTSIWKNTYIHTLHIYIKLKFKFCLQTPTIKTLPHKGR